jgi:hypothetical protein
MIWYPTVNCESRGGRPPVAIILHRTDGPWEAAWSWFLYDKSWASAHYLVGVDGRLAQFVDERDAAWSANVISPEHPPTWPLYEQGGNVNHYTLNVEFEGLPDEPLTEMAYARGLALLTELCAGWFIPPAAPFIAPHSAIYPLHNCPGPGFPWERLLADLKALLPNGFVGEARAAAWERMSCGERPAFVPVFALSLHGWQMECGLPFTGEFNWVADEREWRGQVWLGDIPRLVYCEVGVWSRVGTLRLLPRWQ